MNREWRKSSFSGALGNCVEIGSSWRRPGGCADNANNCVEVNHVLDGVRDSKNTTGPSLTGIDVGALVAYVRATA